MAWDFIPDPLMVNIQRTGSNYQEKMKKGSNCRGLLLRDSHEAASWVDLIVMDGDYKSLFRLMTVSIIGNRQLLKDKLVSEVAV